MLIRHWSLYDAMLHSGYLGTKLHIWSEAGKKRLHKLLAKMGMSLNQVKQNYTHMDVDLKRGLRDRLEKYAPLYGLNGIVKEGFVRCWGWKGCLSAVDVGYIIGSILEVGTKERELNGHQNQHRQEPALSQDPDDAAAKERSEKLMDDEAQEFVDNFWAAYDALAK